MKSSLLFLVLYFFSLTLLFGQHHVTYPEHPSNHKESYFRISMAIAHTYLPKSTIEEKKMLILPSFGLDIEYWLNHHWGIGLHNDLELLNFEVQIYDTHAKNDVYIEREFPVLITLDALWKPRKSLVLFGGPGVEIEPSENYFVWRVGMEYEVHFAQNLDLAPIVFYDFRHNAYNTFSVGLGVGYEFK